MKTTLQRKGFLWFQIILLSLVCIAQIIASQPLVSQNSVSTPNIQISNACTCLNNEESIGTGQFSEVIIIQSVPGETWTVTQVSGLYQPLAQVPPLPAEAIEEGLIISENPLQPGEYSLDVVHIDAIGYTLEVSNGTDTLTITNRCYYANPEIDLLDNYCINYPAIPIEVISAPYTGSVTALVNGVTSTHFEPGTLGSGPHTVTVTFEALPLDEFRKGCRVQREKTITVYPNYVGGFACSHINVGLNEFGFAKITPQMLLMGDYGCFSTFEIDIIGRDTDTLWCSDIGTTFMVRVTDPVRLNSCWARVTPEDKMGPTIQCRDTTLFCGTELFARPITDFVEVRDNCDSQFQFVLLNQSPFSNPTCHPDYSAAITRTYRATDRYGNTSVCTHTIYLDRPVLSEIQAPADITLSCEDMVDLTPESLGYPHVGGQEIGFYCEFSITHSDFSFTSCPGTRTIKRTFWITDLCTREMRMLAQIIQIQDTVAPVIVCPSLQTIVNDPLQCAGTYRFPTIVATDNCAAPNQISFYYFANGLSVTPPNPVSLPVGVNQIVIWAQDPCLNLGICQYEVVVVDQESPNMACNPATVSLNVDGFVVVHADSLDNNYMDNCALADTLIARMGDPVFGETITFECDDLGNNPMIVVRVSDIYGNVNSCMVSVEVQDKLGPNVIFCPPAINLQCNIDDEDPGVEDPVFSDNCDPAPQVVRSLDVRVELCCESYSITREWVATDNMGNTGVCRQVITWEDTTAPDLVCLDSFEVYLDANGVGEVNLEDIFLDASDVCCGEQTPHVFAGRTFTCEDLGESHFITLFATDDCGNQGSCVVEITVLDTVAPVLLNCNDVTLSLSNLQDCNPSEIITYLINEELQAQDNCDEAPEIFSTGSSIIEGFCQNTPGILIANLTFGVRDQSENERANACALTLTYRYDVPPSVVRCSSEFTVQLDIDGEASLSVSDVFEAASLCGLPITYSETQFNFNCDSQRDTIITIFADQPCSITGVPSVSCTTRIAIEDNIPSEINCPNNLITLQLEADGTVSLTAAVLSVTATDNCHEGSFLISPGILDCTNLESEISVVISYTDADATVSCTVLVEVEDNAKPTAVCPEAYVVGNVPTQCYGILDIMLPTSLDNCGAFSIASVSSTYEYPVGVTTTVTVTATDGSGNTDTCQFTVTVEDTEPPVIECSDLSPVSCVEDIPQIVIWLEATAYDNCSEQLNIIPYTYESNVNECGEGTIVFTFTDSDEAGNVGVTNCMVTLISEMQTFDVNDISWPITPLVTSTIECDGDISPEALNSEPSLSNPYWCLGVTFTEEDVELTPESGECRRVERTWTARAGCSNTILATFIQTIVIESDDFGPIIVQGIARTEYGYGAPKTHFMVGETEMGTEGDMAGRYEIELLDPITRVEIIPANFIKEPAIGVTVADLYELSRYVHGKERYLSPYQIIAADADRNGRIDSDDATILREVILGSRTGFPVSNWRFVDNDFAFKDNNNPLAEIFPETKWLSIDHNKNSYQANFVAIPMGDINTSFDQGSRQRMNDVRKWYAKNMVLKMGSWNEVPIYASELTDIEAAQFTIEADLKPGESITIQGRNQGQLDWVQHTHLQQAISLAWYKKVDENLKEDQPVFTIRWYALEERDIKNALQLTSSITTAKQYNLGDRDGVPVLDIINERSAAYELFQNEPNPFVNQTAIAYQLPEAEDVNITIYDITGKLVLSIKEKGKKGMNRRVLEGESLLQDGVYYYQIEAGSFRAAKKMIKIK